MLKPKPVFLMLFMLILSPLVQGYERNQAVPVEKVVYGQVQSVNLVTKEELVADQYHGWRTFGGALIGGVVGHQFGGGSGQDVATVLGSLLGAAIASEQGGDRIVQYRLVELLIKQDDGQQVMVLQDPDPRVSFQTGDEVRVVYFPGYVRVDPAM
ncbi:glycine zipper 2TM domain-containing protein [Shewanella submarina]|uniref:Glycine zipper 2TM domain-containing protein n=1 Tax=Shewanella submarina TaxID=2016376 RepID=A0ABV7GDQ9_9GAMM|nr:glycine zipper 2TM domain-containing protein [Shewanella submarina]MCL1037547.1 glycine zipper 2TM domain-containing protein [Shewanella submarina]